MGISSEKKKKKERRIPLPFGIEGCLKTVSTSPIFILQLLLAAALGRRPA